MKPRLHRIKFNGIAHYAKRLYHGKIYETLCRMNFFSTDIQHARHFITCIACMATPIDPRKYREPDLRL